MKPARFAYHRPRDLREALDLLAEYRPDARPLAGGQSLIPAMNFRLAQPSRLVDLNEIGELAFIRGGEDGSITFGAMTRQRVAERNDLTAARAPLLVEALRWVAHPQIRNRGTLGGSLAHADPSAELPAVAVALDASFKLATRDSERWVRAADFFQGLFATALEPGELLTEIRIPKFASGAGAAFEEISRRRGDFALVGVVAVLECDSEGRCTRARIVLLSVGEGPVMAKHAESALTGKGISEAVLHDAARLCAATDIDPPGDLHASPAYRRHLTQVLTQRALARAAAQALQKRG